MIRSTLATLAVLSLGSIAHAQTPVERGDYLVNGILTCGNCHTPRGPGGVLDMSKQLSGGPQTWDTAQYRVKGSNITPDRETGIGEWTSEQIKRAVQDGMRPNGTPARSADAIRFLQDFYVGRSQCRRRLRQVSTGYAESSNDTDL